MARLTKAESEKLKKLAYHIYTKDKYITIKELAIRVGVTEKTASEWIREGDWEKIRRTVQTTKAEQIEHLYAQMSNLNQKIAERENKYPDSKEANTLIQLSTAIKKLESETGLGELTLMAQEFIGFVAQIDFEKSKELIPFLDQFIATKIK